ncbi:aromatic acid exporter family protein [Candidatus Synechococcus calcipolaris G9]|uniref:Aromatic acid exporter family protein n=1 Tax=Candidatus Synechococcus calcipolaris G9 TaxID=1497997 RepID=A0ABT6F381_9SYNE|nr:aromatic acid exporter family protein [Candidatus Synechococcus calcipolaris]MDG2992303.1 aromatic acid exporter family protein [Candidatus Synechococcus calcipolaris G9]
MKLQEYISRQWPLIPWKHAIKVGLAAALLATVFWQSNLQSVEYPVMGLVATMLSTNVGETLKAGWGRLGGSILGGIFAALSISLLGLNPISGMVAFLAVMIICQSLKLSALQNQAIVVAVLIASSSEIGKDPWNYALNRVFDNGIGILIGILITLLIWPDRPQLTLRHQVTTVLAELGHTLERLLHRLYVSPPPTMDSRAGSIDSTGTGILEGPKTLEDIEDRQFQAISNQLRQADTLLDKSIYGIAGWQLAQENWSTRLTLVRRLRRHLRSLARLVPLIQNKPILSEFIAPMERLGQGLIPEFNQLTEAIATSEPPVLETTPTQQALEILYQDLNQRRNQRRRQGKNQAYELEDVVHTYATLNSLSRIHRDLTLLAQAFQPEPQLTQLNLAPQPHFKEISLPTPLYYNRLKHILKGMVALGLTLFIIESANLPFGYYATIAVVICLQSTLGNSLRSAWQRTVGTFLGAVIAHTLIYTLGATPLSIGLGVTLLIVSMNFLGMPQGHKPGAFLLILALMVYPSQPEPYIWGRFLETELGIGIALLVGLCLWPDTSARHLDQEIKANFQRLGQLYGQVVQQCQTQGANPDLEALINAVRQSYRQQLQLKTMATLEPVQALGLAQKRRFWNIYENYQFSFLSSLFSFEAIHCELWSADESEQSSPPSIQAMFQGMEPELGALVHLGSQSLDQATEMPPDSAALTQGLQDLEQKLQFLRSQRFFRAYPLEVVLDVFSILGIIQEISENLIQFGQESSQPAANMPFNPKVDKN